VRGRWVGWAVLCLVAAGYLVRGVLALVNHLPEAGDTAVYQAGAAALLNGHPLYDADFLPGEPAYAQLPFTYAPFAAVFFIPLIPFPLPIAWGLLNALSVLAMGLVAYLVLRKVPRRPAWLAPEWGAAAVAVVMLFTEPVGSTLGYGQVNLLLMAMVVVDVLVVCGASGKLGRFGGVLIGVAAAIKLTPLIFVVHLLLTGRKAEAARAAQTFAGLQALMLVISPHDTVRFWTHTVFDSSRIGPTQWSFNQSLSSVVRRLSDMAWWSQPVAYAVGAVLAIGAFVLIRRFDAGDRPIHALLVTAFLALLISPVSWLHHWVWIVPLAALLLAEAFSGNRFAQVLLPLTVVFFTQVPMHSMTPGENGEAALNPWTFFLSNEYVFFPILPGIAVFLLQRRSARVRAAAYEMAA
jgi:alpha-1,2-mannosyltransferase